MSLPINNHCLDDIENDFSNISSSENSIQLNTNLNENLVPAETYREIIERGVGDITKNNSSESNSPFFIISHQINQEKKKRGRKVDFNIKRTKKVVHLSSDEDNILIKVQTHYLNFIIYFLNDCIYNYYGNRKIKFIKFARYIKTKVTIDSLKKMKNSSIYNLLKEIGVSPKFSTYDTKNNEKNAEILSKIPWFKKLLELKFLDLFYYYYNDTKQLKKIFLFEKEITLTKDTKSYYFLLEKNKAIKKKIIEITKYNYIFSNISWIETNKITEEYSDNDNEKINYYE